MKSSDPAPRVYNDKEEVLGLTQKWKEKGETLVFTNGCFDILHAGHVDYLQKAAEKGDRLLIGLNSDSSVKRIKGANRPINSQTQRALVLAALRCVDAVVLFEEDTPIKLIEAVQPIVLVKGGDYKGKKVVGEDVVKANGGRLELIDFVHDISTTSIQNTIKQND